MNIAQTFQNEHNIASKFMEHPDFVEGVSAHLIRKPAQTPEWSKTTFDQVSETELDFSFADELRLQLPMTRHTRTTPMPGPHCRGKLKSRLS